MATLPDVRSLLAMSVGLLCLAMVTSARAQEARLKNITLSSAADRMVVSMHVQGAFTPEMIEALHQGAKTEFTFRIRLFRDRRMWLDQKLVHINLAHALTYDASRNVYEVYRSWAPAPVVATPSLTEAQALMSQIARFAILPLDQMRRGEGYELRAKAELSKVTLPYYLRYVFYFVTFWDFETEWHSVYFIY